MLEILLSSDLEKLRAALVASAALLHRTISADQRRLEDVKRRLAALDVLMAPSADEPIEAMRTAVAPEVVGDGAVDGSSRALGAKILDWAERILANDGAQTADILFEILPAEFKTPFDHAGTLPAAFRFRRLFRRRPERFKVRRSDGLVTLLSSVKQGAANEASLDVLSAILVDPVTQIPWGFSILGSTGSKTQSFGALRRHLKNDSPVFVRGADDRISMVEARGAAFRSVHDGQSNNDLASLPKIKRTEDVK